MAQVGPLERRTRARDGLAGGNAFARSAETARTVPARSRRARVARRSGRATPRRRAVAQSVSRAPVETTDADVAATPRPPHPRRRLSLSTRPRWLRYAPSLRCPGTLAGSRLLRRARAALARSVLYVSLCAGVSHPPAVCADKSATAVWTRNGGAAMPARATTDAFPTPVLFRAQRAAVRLQGAPTPAPAGGARPRRPSSAAVVVRAASTDWASVSR